MEILNSLKWLTHTKLGWLIISFLWVGIFMIVDNNIKSNWAFLVAMPGFVYMGGLCLVFMVYAWVINPIREYKENKKLRSK